MCHKIHRDRSIDEFIAHDPKPDRCVYPVWGVIDRDHTFTQCDKEPKRKVEGHPFCVEHAKVVKQILVLTTSKGD